MDKILATKKADSSTDTTEWEKQIDHKVYIYSKIRIIRYQYIVKEGTLFPEEVDQYDSFTIRESLNNCIAHQDYTKGCRINVIEGEDQLTFENAGLFIPNSVEQVVKDNSPESHYRNPFLATAMMNLNLVETAGGGIRKLFEIQKKKFSLFQNMNFLLIK